MAAPRPIIFGGLKRSATVPVVAVGYILIALGVILLNITEVPAACMSAPCPGGGSG